VHHRHNNADHFFGGCLNIEDAIPIADRGCLNIVWTATPNAIMDAEKETAA